MRNLRWSVKSSINWNNNMSPLWTHQNKNHPSLWLYQCLREELLSNLPKPSIICSLKITSIWHPEPHRWFVCLVQLQASTTRKFRRTSSQMTMMITPMTMTLTNRPIHTWRKTTTMRPCTDTKGLIMLTEKAHSLISTKTKRKSSLNSNASPALKMALLKLKFSKLSLHSHK